MWSLVWYLAIGLLLWGALSGHPLHLDGAKKEKFKMAINYFEMCPEHLDVPSTYDDLQLIMDPDVEDILLVDGVLNMREAIPVGTNLEVDLRKCYTEDRKSCEKYLVHVCNDVCAMLQEKDAAWSESLRTFTEHIEGLQAECPIASGSYNIVEAPVNLKFLGNFTKEVGHWQVEISFVSPEKRYGCILVDLTLTLKRMSLS